MSNTIPRPETFFGFRLGSDHKIARWDKIVDYFKLMDDRSDNIHVINMGPTTEGNPFLLAIISSAGNLARLDELKRINAQIADPRGLSQARINRLIKNGRAVVCQSMSLHASEIAATQMSAELAHELVCGADKETTEILENTVFLMVPCFNPDGQIMITDWYNEYVGTEYEGTPLPWLYHKYCGHDNNRDAFMLNLVESQYMARIMFQEWHPQVFQDHHELGAYGPRLFVVPYCEPIHPHAAPLVWRELGWYGSHMAYKLEQAGVQGVVNGALFGGWAHLGFHWMGNYHNIASMLTETAQARLATPIYIHPHQLAGDGSTLRGMPHYKAQTNFPNPWSGGWWRLRDMIEQQLIASKAVLHLAAQYRETVLSNAVQKALRQTQRGEEEPSSGFLIKTDQHDPLTVNALINKPLLQGIEIQKMRHQVRLGDFTYPAGAYFVPLNQPKRGVIKSLLERTFFPDDAWTRFQDGTPNRPYDAVTDTMAEMMGVTADPVPADCTVLASKRRAYTKVTEPIAPGGEVIGTGTHGYVFDSRLNEAYRVVNKLLASGVEIYRLTTEIEVDDSQRLPVGSFLIGDTGGQDLLTVADTSGVSFHSLKHSLNSEMSLIKARRIGVYNRYWGGNIDEGWTRLTLEQFGFPYETLRDERIVAGNLHEAYEAIVFPDDSTEMIVCGDEELEKRLRNTPVPKQYRSGIGDVGVENIRAFVENGGTLITINRACEFAIEKLGLQMKNVVRNKPIKEFFCPGSTLRVEVDTSHPLGHGMPSGALALFWDSPVFSIDGSYFNGQYHVVVSYLERDILQSGWLVGEEHLSNRAAVVSVKYGVGCVILYGFRVQFRATTHGTFKLLFNGLLGE